MPVLLTICILKNLRRAFMLGRMKSLNQWTAIVVLHSGIRFAPRIDFWNVFPPTVENMNCFR